MLRALKHEDDFMRLLCSSVWSLRWTSGLFRWAWIASDRRVWFRVWGWRADFRRRSRKEESYEESSHGCSWELVALYIAGFVKSVANFCVLCTWCWNFSRNLRKWSCLDWRGDWWTVEGASYSCYREPGTVGWGPSMMSLRLSTVEVGAGSCWSRRLMLVIFVFKWGLY